MLYNDKKFIYFLYGMDYTCLQSIEEIFQDGLLNLESNNLDNFAIRVDNKEDLLQNINEYRDYCSNVLIIKIPREYIEVENNKVAPLPIWKILELYKRKYYLVNSLIYGVYQLKTNTVIYNSNYCPVYDPNGLHYDFGEQTLPLFKKETMDKYHFMNNRPYGLFEELYEMDTQNKTFDASIEYYNSYFNIPKQDNNRVRALKPNLVA